LNRESLERGSSFSFSESENRIKKSFFDEKIQLGKVTCLYYYFSKFVVTSRGNHGNHWLLSMIFLLLLFKATFIPNLKFLA